jgi:hypothetical protein
MRRLYPWYLVELDLLEEFKDTKFRTTEKTQEFPSHYKNMAKLLFFVVTSTRKRGTWLLHKPDNNDVMD